MVTRVSRGTETSDVVPSLLVRTVENLTGVRIDHYVAVDLAGFRRITDAIGGVDVCIKPSKLVEYSPNDSGTDQIRSTNTDDPFSNFHGRAGLMHLDGDQALAFVRQRHGLEGGDTARIRRQQQFLGQVFRQSTSRGVLLNPGRLGPLLSAVGNALTLDEGTSINDLEKLGSRMRGQDPAKLRFETVPTRDLKESDPGAVDLNGSLQYREPGQENAVGSVQLIDQPAFEALLATLKNTEVTPTPASTQPARVTVPPSQVLLTVKNGTPTSGVARRATDDLGRLGFRTTLPSQAEATTFGASEVRYAAGEEEEAKTVAAAVPGSQLRIDPTVTTGVVLVVGTSYTGAVPVQVAGSDSPSPSAAPSSSPTSTAPNPITAADPDNRCTF